jgi:hypothetical protein
MQDSFGRLGEGRRQQMEMPGADELTPEQFEALWEASL